MAESSSYRKKTLLEKEKLLVTSNFSFSHSVLKRLVLQTRKNQGLFGKGLKTYSRFYVETNGERFEEGSVDYTTVIEGFFFL